MEASSNTGGEMNRKMYTKPMATNHNLSNSIIPLAAIAAISAAEAAAIASGVGLGLGLAMGRNKGRSEIYSSGKIKVLQNLSTDNVY